LKIKKRREQMSFSKTRTYPDPYSDRKLPSVTSILGLLDKPALMYWSVNCACDYIQENCHGVVSLSKKTLFNLIEKARKEWRNVGKKAMDIGTQVHENIQYYLENNLKEPKIEDENVLSAFIAFLEWKDKHNLVPIACEHVVYGKDYAGTVDLICKLDDKVTLIDFKSSKAIYDEYWYQAGAYANAWDLGTSPFIEQVGILRLDKETGYPDWETKTREEIDKYYIAFLKLVDFWWAKKNV
jgi:hypothetical protein